MSTEAEIATQLVSDVAKIAGETVKIAMGGSIAVIKVAGKGAAHGAALLAAVISGKKKSRGKVRLQAMLKEQGGITLFTLQKDDLANFAKTAKQYGIKYCIVKDKNSSGNTVDMFVRSMDAPVINRIIEKYSLNAVHMDVQLGNSDSLTENASLSGRGLQEEEYEYGDITISRELNSLVIEETEEGQIKTRVPGTWGDKIRYLWLDKDNVREVHNGKSYFTHIEPEETYDLYNDNGQLAETITGENLLKYYDRKDKGHEPDEKEYPVQHQDIRSEAELRPSVRKKLDNAVMESDEINVAEQDILKSNSLQNKHINPEEVKKQNGVKKVNAFNNFSQRAYNFNEMEKSLLAASESEKVKGGKLPEMTRQ